MGAVGYTGGDPSKVDVAGDTMTGPLVLPGDPSSGLEAATKDYVDAAGGGGGGGSLPALTVTSETSYGITPAVGVGTRHARDDHTHGSPAAPTAASVGASPTGHNHTGVYDPAGSAAAAQSAAIAAAVADVDAHEADTTSVHGITDTSVLATNSSVASAVSTHNADTTNVHGITDTSALATTTDVTTAVSNHSNDTTNIHGITNTVDIIIEGDSRLTDSRVPTAHAASHTDGGADEITVAQGQVTNLTTDLAAKAPLASPTFTGTPAAPTAAQATNTTQLATTAFVQTASGLLVPKNTVTTKGDILVATAADTITRLGVGSNDQVLTADSAQATGLKWATPSGGSGGAGLPNNIVPISTRWHPFPVGRISSNRTMDLNRGFFNPLPIGADGTIDQLGIEVVTGGGAGAVIRAVIWGADASTRVPTTSLVDLGTIDSTTTGLKTWTGVARAVTANTLYWVAFIAQVATCVVRAIGSYNPYVFDSAGFTGTGETSCVTMTGLTGAVSNGTSFTFSSSENGPRTSVRFS